ncbi:MAG: glycosyltransferase [Richelia sp. RM2_1_2]|nr:glycosyltransferase [Richelia sp. RM2_1_2]
MNVPVDSYLISVILINFNNAEGLRKTLNSLDIQSYKNYQLIYIDAGSTDESIQIADSYSHIISKKIIGEDNGIYDAMNIGIKFANGQYFIFLNSGDYLYSPDVFSYFSEQTNNDNVNHVFFGYASTISDNTSWLFPSSKYTININILKKWLQEYEPTHQQCFSHILFVNSIAMIHH